MLNRDVYMYDPRQRKLANDGVANVNDEPTQQALNMLRSELETFVCEGQYYKGLERILNAYISNIHSGQQPGVWVSGFFGSGKSHLVKMLRALWFNTSFPDGTLARNIASLPPDITDLLKELDTEGKRYGGVHAVSGTFKSASSESSTRMALLRLVLKSAGLPGSYSAARLVMWLKKEQIFEQVKQIIEASGGNCENEIDHFYVSEKLHQALVQLKPSVFPTNEVCTEVLRSQFPNVNDVNNDDMIKTIQDALSTDGKFPLTVIVIDEVQQYIYENSIFSNEIQEIVETCSKHFNGKLLFVGTGQTAITGTPNMRKLEGRFTLRIELSDSDVDTVIRKVLLQKKPAAIPYIKHTMEENIGEISRHLSGTTFQHWQEDKADFSQDYPILPVRRRFWESSLRILDLSGTESQLRNQMKIVFNAIKSNLDKSIGNVIPADFLFFELASLSLQQGILDREIYNKSITWLQRGTSDEQLIARACGIIFLVNKLIDIYKRNNIEGKRNDTGINCNINTIADLMVDDLSTDSRELREKLPKLLDKCEILINIDGEYRLKTRESARWDNEFKNQLSTLSNESYRLEQERNDRINKKLVPLLKKITIAKGDPKKNDKINFKYDPIEPSASEKKEKVFFWVRDEWMIDENAVREDAMKEGNNASLIFVLIPRHSLDILNRDIGNYIAASKTLDILGISKTAEGIEARAFIETKKNTALVDIEKWIDIAFSRAKVFMSGGREINNISLEDSLKEAASNAAERLYSLHHLTGQNAWDKIFAKAVKGDPDALKISGGTADINENRVCNEILNFIGSGKLGQEIHKHFYDPPYGWDNDPIDGGLMVLYAAGRLLAFDERRKDINLKVFERKMIGKTFFKTEEVILSAQQRIDIRKLMQKLNISANPKEEVNFIPEFLSQLTDLAKKTGGEPPKPEIPNTLFIEELKRYSGNQQIIEILSNGKKINDSIRVWEDKSQEIEKRMLIWSKLEELLQFSTGLENIEDIKIQFQSIKQNRHLLENPDPISPLLKNLGNLLRAKLHELRNRFYQERNTQLEELQEDMVWKNVVLADRQNILKECGIDYVPELDIVEHKQLVETMKQYPFNWWMGNIDALPNRINKAREMASKLLEPKSQAVDIPRRTLKNQKDIHDWLEDVEKSLKEAITRGPVVLR